MKRLVLIGLLLTPPRALGSDPFPAQGLVYSWTAAGKLSGGLERLEFVRLCHDLRRRTRGSTYRRYEGFASCFISKKAHGMAPSLVPLIVASALVWSS